MLSWALCCVVYPVSSLINCAKCQSIAFSQHFTRIPVYTTSIRRRDYNRCYMIANLNNLLSLNHVSQVPNSRFCKNFTSCLLNARSVCNKTLAIKDFVVDHAVDLLGITETWLHLKGDDVTIGELCLSVYRFVHTPDRQGLVVLQTRLLY